MYHAIIFILEVFFIISCVHFWGCLLILSIFDVHRATASKYWIEFDQKSIAAVRCSPAYVLQWRVTSLRNLLRKHRMDIRHWQGDHLTILVNFKRYYLMLENIRKVLTISDNILTFLRLSLQLRIESAEIVIWRILKNIMQ